MRWAMIVICAAAEPLRIGKITDNGEEIAVDATRRLALTRPTMRSQDARFDLPGDRDEEMKRNTMVRRCSGGTTGPTSKTSARPKAVGPAGEVESLLRSTLDALSAHIAVLDRT